MYKARQGNCPCPTKPRPLGLSDFHGTVDVIVGEGEEGRFTIHKPLLVASAPFFRAALKGSFKEAEEERLNLPDDEPDVFERFQLWLYSGSALTSTESPQNIGWAILIRLCVFAEKYGITDLQNSSIDFIASKSNVTLDISTVFLRFVYDNTAKTSLLRRLLVDLSAQQCDLNEWFMDSQEASKSPAEYMVDLIKALYELKNKKTVCNNWGQLGCKYHIHPPNPSAAE